MTTSNYAGDHQRCQMVDGAGDHDISNNTAQTPMCGSIQTMPFLDAKVGKCWNMIGYVNIELIAIALLWIPILRQDNLLGCLRFGTNCSAFNRLLIDIITLSEVKNDRLTLSNEYSVNWIAPSVKYIRMFITILVYIHVRKYENICFCIMYHWTPLIQPRLLKPFLVKKKINHLLCICNYIIFIYVYIYMIFRFSSHKVPLLLTLTLIPAWISNHMSRKVCDVEV